MTVIAEISIPANSFELGRILDGIPDAEIKFEPIVPLRERTLPLIWMLEGDADELERHLSQHSLTESVQRLGTNDSKTLFEVQWINDIDGVVNTLLETDAQVLSVSGTSETWNFRLRFLSHEALSRFNMSITDNGTPVTLRRLHNPMLPDEQSSLSSHQREALELAYHRGYFEVPRRATLTELAQTVGISDSAFSQRIRRGTTTLLEQTLISQDT